MTICLHVGLHKTGTSSIQSVLSANHDALLSHGVEFPLLGGPKGVAKVHRAFSACLRGNNPTPERDALVTSWRPSQPRTVISAEGFSRGEAETIARVRDFFGEDVHVICALRDPVTHMLSHHRQKSSVGGQADALSNFLADHHTEMLEAPGTAYYAYDDKIARWGATFRISTLIYRGENDIVDDFLRVAGLTGMVGEVNMALSRRNPSVDTLTAAVLRALTRLQAANRLEAEAVRRARASIRKHQPRIMDALKDHAVEETVDFRAFKADFARLNPVWAHLLEGAPDAARSISGFSMGDEPLLEIVSGVLRQRL